MNPIVYRLAGAAILTLAGVPGCGAPAADSAALGGGGAVTLWTDSTELFMEYPPLIVGQPARLAVHLTDVTDFAPLAGGDVRFVFTPRDGGEATVVEQNAPRAPGIYGPQATFRRAGLHDLTIVIASPQIQDTIRVAGLQVYESAAATPPSEDEADEGIPFLKEQQWRTPGFATAFTTEGSVVESFEAPGEIVPAAGRAANVAAPIDALISAGGATQSPAPGQWVRQGQPLVVLTPVLGETGSAYAQARRELREAEDEHARVTRLYAAEAVARRRLHEAESRLQAAREALAGLAGAGAGTADSAGTLPLRAPIAGVVAGRRIVPGSRVAAGDLLFRIVDPSVVWLEVHVPVGRAASLDAATGARFRPEGATRTYQSRRTVSIGTVVDSLTRTVLVLYEAANPDGTIKVGATAAVAVSTGRPVPGVVVPSSAILDEDGRPICYVQVSGERFEKRQLVIGADDGTQAVVLSGLRADERVVTGAAYQVRLASLSTSVPAEGHAH